MATPLFLKHSPKFLLLNALAKVADTQTKILKKSLHSLLGSL